ncbi:uncharacterized protein At3g17950 [Magnolia sinica]|uniref:uncharacterized protein At3g17950 n=1 Tax=Magnolia sinica TaxID=86752 RepID=UPI00265A5FF0|nr:uncharacterized protein At3g17950 [Magnolia sinica]
MDQPNNLLPSSPTISSLSSSDLDTESTGSFFHDRSTTLGTLMGVTFPPLSVRVSSGRENAASTGDAATATALGGGRNKKPADRRRHHGRRWWKLCREDSRAPSLADFLEIERRFGDGSDNRFFYSAPAEHESAGNGALFADGRVLPPPQAAVQSPSAAVCRFPVAFNGICCGGGG